MIGGVAAAIAVAALAAVFALASGDGGGSDPAPDPPARSAPTAPRVDRFDADRAFAQLRRQVELGPRPAGSDAPRGRFERVPGHPGLRNVVGRIPGTKPAIAIAAHYDTKDLPGFVGANDGAAGTAAVLELARALRRMDRPAGAPQVRFLLFDGEEATDDSRPFRETGLRGSTAYAERHEGEIGALILLDFIAARDLSIRRERNSDRELWGMLRAAARRVGAGTAFPSGSLGAAMTDDHVPFLERGVRAIDVIQWPYECFHRSCDDVSAVSERSLDLTGETVLQLVRTLLR